MTAIVINELTFRVTREAGGRFVAECLTESIVTQADTREELRAMVLDAVEAFYSDAPKPRSIQLE